MVVEEMSMKITFAYLLTPTARCTQATYYYYYEHCVGTVLIPAAIISRPSVVAAHCRF
jgi:hypothetical protein